MSVLNSLLNSTNTTVDIQDRDMSYTLLKDSKFNISCTTKAVTEAVNPQLRELLISQLTEAVKKHHELSDLMIKKNWYLASGDPNQQLQKDIMESPIRFKK